MQQKQQQKRIEKSLQLVVSKLQSFGKEEFVSNSLYGASLHLLKKPGKLLRPALVFIGSMLLNLKEDFVDLAAAVELLHVSSLIHDDIIDNSCTRRGMNAVHIKYGKDQALLAGDALIANAIKLASPYGEKVVTHLSNAAMAMCAGESLELESKINSLKRYMQVAYLKTAVLIGASLSVAGVYANSKLAQNLNTIGIKAGLAFQIRDDVLDYLEGEQDSSHSNIVEIMSSGRLSHAVDRAILLNNKNVDEAVSASGKLPDGAGKRLLTEYLEGIRLSRELR